MVEGSDMVCEGVMWSLQLPCLCVEPARVLVCLGVLPCALGIKVKCEVVRGCSGSFSDGGCRGSISAVWYIAQLASVRTLLRSQEAMGSAV